MKHFLTSKKNTPIITNDKNMDTKDNEPVITFYDWLLEKYGGKLCDRNGDYEIDTPEGIADDAKFSVDELDELFDRPRYNRLCVWYKWIQPYAMDDATLELFVQLWSEYRKEVPYVKKDNEEYLGFYLMNR